MDDQTGPTVKIHDSKLIEHGGSFGFGSFLCGLAVALVAACFVYAYVELPHHPTDPKCEITGPDKIEFAGQLVYFNATWPGKNPKHLVFTWHAQPLDVCAMESTAGPCPILVPTEQAGRTQFTTPAGEWGLWCSITDPAKKQGQMVFRKVSVPGGSKPEPKPDSPKPDPAPKPIVPAPLPPAPKPVEPLTPVPAPSPPQPPPNPANRFSDFTSKVTTWLAAVNSPDKSSEAAKLRDATLNLVKELQPPTVLPDGNKTGGSLSHLSGLSLELSVVRAVGNANAAAIQANRQAWLSFKTQVGTYARQMVNEGKLHTPADWAEFMQAFAAGLA